jgi:hypothetical protein
MWEWVVKATTQLLEEEAVWAPGPVWKVMERRKFHDLAGVRNPYRPTRSELLY